MDWFPLFKSALLAAVASAWPEVLSGSFAVATAIEKRNWVNLLSARTLKTPWVVADVRIAPTDEWGIGPGSRYEVTTTLYYIASDKDLAALGAATADVALYGRAAAMRVFLREQESDPPFPGTILDDIGEDAGTENPVNASMLAANQPFQSVSVSFTTIVVDMS